MSVDTCERDDATFTTTLPTTIRRDEVITTAEGPAPESINNAIPGWVLGVAAVLVCIMRLMYS